MLLISNYLCFPLNNYCPDFIYIYIQSVIWLNLHHMLMLLLMEDQYIKRVHFDFFLGLKLN